MNQQKKNLIDAINQAISEGHGWHVPPELQKGGIFGNVLLPKESEIDILKKKLEIATEALKYAAENNDHPEVMAEDALERMAELDGD